MRSQPLSIGLVIVVFLATVYPYISTSKRIFGRYFYNVNSTFYMWNDSWEEVKKGTRAHGDRVGWPKMPPELIPSPRKYLREHSIGQILRREVNGLRVVITKCARSYGYFKYVVIYTLFLLSLVFARSRRGMEMISEYLFLVSFCLSYFVAYLMLYGWYAPIVSGNRLILAQFIPFMFSLCFILGLRYFRGVCVWMGGRRVALVSVFDRVLLWGILVEIYFVMSGRILSMYGGE